MWDVVFSPSYMVKSCPATVSLSTLSESTLLCQILGWCRVVRRGREPPRVRSLLSTLVIIYSSPHFGAWTCFRTSWHLLEYPWWQGAHYLIKLSTPFLNHSDYKKVPNKLNLKLPLCSFNPFVLLLAALCLLRAIFSPFPVTVLHINTNGPHISLESPLPRLVTLPSPFSHSLTIQVDMITLVSIFIRVI